MAKKKVKKYHQGGSHEDHHVQSRPIPKEKIVSGPGGIPRDPNAPKKSLSSTLVEQKKAINKANQKKAGMVPATKGPPAQRIPFAPTVRPQPIAVGGPKQVQPMPTQRPTVVGVTPRPLAQPQPMRRPSRQQLVDLFGRIINDNERQGRTASRVNPNAVLGTPRRRRRR
jgi:hypothetical protein